nr:hypothetical protein [Petrachloros mirabilis]
MQCDSATVTAYPLDRNPGHQPVGQHGIEGGEHFLTAADYYR